jgi:hypothetical protein
MWTVSLSYPDHADNANAPRALSNGMGHLCSSGAATNGGISPERAFFEVDLCVSDKPALPLQPSVIGRRILEAEVDQLLARQLRTNPMFAYSLFSRSFASEPLSVNVIKVETNVHVDRRQISGNPLAYGENDVEVIAEVTENDGKKRRLALLIENKISAPLMEDQGRRYGVRGLDRSHAGDWADYRCMFVAPRDRISQLYPTKNYSKAGWDVVLDFEQLAEILYSPNDSQDAQLLLDATVRENCILEPILEAVKFWEEYEAYAHQADLPVKVRSEQGSRAGGVWPSFYDDDFRKSKIVNRKRIQIVHIDNAGRVVLFLKRVNPNDFENVIRPLLIKPLELTKPGTSWQGILVHVPPIDPCRPIVDQCKNLDLAFEAVKLLHLFFLRHQGVIHQLLEKEVWQRAKPEVPHVEQGMKRLRGAGLEPSTQGAAMSFEVFEGLPMPQGPKKKYNFEDLGVGDMFFVPLAKGDDHTTAQNKISSAAASWGKRRDRKFATQMIKNDGKLGIGVWRTE